MASSSPPSIRRTASPFRLVPPSTLRATYSHASLRSAAAPSLARDSASGAPVAPSTAPSAASSVSSSLERANGLSIPESFASGSDLGVEGMIVAGIDVSSEAEAASTTQSSAPSTTGGDQGDASGSGPASTSGGLVVTGEVDTVDADGVVDAVPGEAKQALREHLRRKLSDGTDVFPQSTPRNPWPNLPPVRELHHAPGDEFPERHYFILTNAGKPVFISHEVQGNDSGDLTSAMGLMQALISVFADDGDKIRCINAGRTRISFLLRAPLYYACVSSWREPESVTRLHLDYLHQQILSIITGGQLRRIFERRNNFDLRRLLDGTEGFLFSLISRLEQDLGLTTGSLAAVRIDPALRAKAGELLIPPKENKNILYGLLLSRSPSPRVITLTRPKRQSIHPSDLHILLNTLSSKSLSANAAASSSAWLPVCLPKYNSEGFLHVHVSFLGDDTASASAAPAGSRLPKRRKPHSHRKERSTSSEGSVDEVTVEGPQASAPSKVTTNSHANPGAGNEICLVIVTPRRDDFDKVHKWAGTIEESLRTSGLLKSLVSSCKRSEYSVNELAVPGLRHFMYKSRSHVQITSPELEEPYDEVQNRNRLITLYQMVHDELYAKSGQIQGPLKLQCIRTENEVVMGWITQPFELLLALSPHLPKTAIVSAANAVAKWIKKEEGKLFIRDAPVF